MTDWKLARRDLLKKLGVGAACLPLLNATRSAAQPGRNPRLLCVLATQGYRMEFWRPPTGSLGTLPSSAAPLQPWKDQLIFLPDMVNGSVPAGLRGFYGYTSIFYGFGDAKGTTRYLEPNGPTFDQIIANGLPRGVGGRSSLALGVQVDLPPLRPLGERRCIWRGAGDPVTPEGDPMVLYRTLFAGPNGPDMAELKRRVNERKAVVDSIRASLDRFGRRLGTEDRMALQAHIEAIRDIERQLASPVPGGQDCGAMPAEAFAVDASDAKNYVKVLDLQLALALMAFKCGVSRVITLQLSDAEGGKIDFGSFVPGIPANGTGYKSAYRNWADLGANPILGGVDHKRIVDTWWMNRLADLLAKIQAVPDVGGGSLLDSCAVLWANTVNDGSIMDGRKVPWLLAGRCGGYFKSGRCAPSEGRSTTSVMAALCRAMGVANDAYGAPMPEIVA